MSWAVWNIVLLAIEDTAMLAWVILAGIKAFAEGQFKNTWLHNAYFHIKKADDTSRESVIGILPSPKSIMGRHRATEVPSFQTRVPFDYGNLKLCHSRNLSRSTINTLTAFIIETNFSAIPETRKIVLNAHPQSKRAVDELYRYMTGVYLPQRYPNMFRLTDSIDGNLELLNKATQKPVSIVPPKDPESAMSILGTLFDTDLILLQPDHVSKSSAQETSQDHAVYRPVAAVVCFPSGFAGALLVGRELRDIHGPIPGFASKLQLSMERFFSKLPEGKLIRRVNWGVTTKPQLYQPEGTHDHTKEPTEDEAIAANGKSGEDVEIEDCRLRCELQTLHRLPESKAIVFGIKTYTYRLQDIKDEGLGDAMAQAIDGLRQGSAPGMFRYKRGHIWGEKVKEFLRHEFPASGSPGDE